MLSNYLVLNVHALLTFHLLGSSLANFPWIRKQFHVDFPFFIFPATRAFKKLYLKEHHECSFGRRGGVYLYRNWFGA